MMNEQSRRQRPYRTLGWHLKIAREQLRESAAEVSGAVEIDLEVLEKIEFGEQRPSEDVLFLLINHLGLAGEEASSLWEMAGYSSQKDESRQYDTAEYTKQLAFVMPIDIRIIYSDNVHVAANNRGIVMSFLQGTGANNQPLPVTRVGMNKRQARNVLEALRQSLAQTDSRLTMQKYLPPPRRNPDSTNPL